jgi:hypothetical protein
MFEESGLVCVRGVGSWGRTGRVLWGVVGMGFGVKGVLGLQTSNKAMGLLSVLGLQQATKPRGYLTCAR